MFTQHIITEVLPWLGASPSLPHRQGAIEALSCILERVGLRGLVYVVLLLMPVLGTMSDQDPSVRLMGSRVFADLVTLMPLEVRLCVCVCVCMRVCMHVHACVCALQCVCTYVLAYMCVFVCMYSCVRICLHACAIAYIRACLCVFMCKCCVK